MHVRLYGKSLEVPKGPWTYSKTAYDPARRIWIRKEYKFNRPSSEVQVQTYHSPSDAASSRWGWECKGELTIPIWHLPFTDTWYSTDRAEDHSQALDAAALVEHLDATFVGETRAVPTWAETKYKMGVPDRFPEKEKEEPMFRFVTGTRVKVRLPVELLSKLTTRTITGTIVKPTGNYSVLVCADQPRIFFQAHPEICGASYGFTAPVSKVVALAKPDYDALPKHVGVVVEQDFRYAGKTFHAGSIGKPLVVSQDGGRVFTRWLNVGGVGETYIPQRHLQWCYFNPVSFKVNSLWSTSYGSGSGLWAPGDVLVYWSDEPHAIQGGKAAITKGVILRYEGYDASPADHVKATVLSGMTPNMVGHQTQIKKSCVKKYEGNFIPVQSKVEVVAEIMFKKRSLQGMLGRVILSNDCEEDVGVQFFENLEAGSLDGVGKEGHCLYLPAESIRRVSG